MVKFLIIRFSSIGDIVLTTPVVRCLKKKSEEFQVHYLTKKRFLSVIESNPYIDKIHTLDDNFSELVKELKAENFDYIIDLHKNIRTLRFKNSLKRVSFTFNKLNFKKWLIVNLKINKLPDLHIVDRYFEAVRVFSVENDNKGLDFFTKKEDELFFSNYSDFPTNPYLAFVIGGGHYTKQVPLEKLTGLINSIKGNIILLGGNEDMIKAKNIEANINKKVFNLVGKINIGQSAFIIKNASLIVTPDTGMMHIAAAYKKVIFSIWGNTIPEFGMAPYLPSAESEIFELKELNCRPCSKIGFKQCPKKHFKCMNDQDFDQLSNKINSQLMRLTSNN